MADELERTKRYIDGRDGAAVAYVAASHELWNAGEKRFGVVRPLLRRDLWSGTSFGELVRIGEDWLQTETAVTAVARVREDFPDEIAKLEELGYREDRRMRMSELDLVANRDRILGMREEARRNMREGGVEIRPLSEDTDPDRVQKLYEMWIESEEDIPITVPWRLVAMDGWERFWFEERAVWGVVLVGARQGAA